jgi:hypothetical protein
LFLFCAVFLSFCALCSPQVDEVADLSLDAQLEQEIAEAENQNESEGFFDTLKKHAAKAPSHGADKHAAGHSALGKIVAGSKVAAGKRGARSKVAAGKRGARSKVAAGKRGARSKAARASAQHHGAHAAPAAHTEATVATPPLIAPIHQEPAAHADERAWEGAEAKAAEQPASLADQLQVTHGEWNKVKELDTRIRAGSLQASAAVKAKLAAVEHESKEFRNAVAALMGKPEPFNAAEEGAKERKRAQAEADARLQAAIAEERARGDKRVHDEEVKLHHEEQLLHETQMKAAEKAAMDDARAASLAADMTISKTQSAALLKQAHDEAAASAAAAEKLKAELARRNLVNEHEAAATLAFRAESNKVRKELGDKLTTEDAQIGSIQSQIAALRTALQEETAQAVQSIVANVGRARADTIATLRGEMAEIRKAHALQLAALKKQLAARRAELKADVSGVAGKVASVDAAMQKVLVSQQAAIKVEKKERAAARVAAARKAAKEKRDRLRAARKEQALRTARAKALAEQELILRKEHDAIENMKAKRALAVAEAAAKLAIAEAKEREQEIARRAADQLTQVQTTILEGKMNQQAADAALDYQAKMVQAQIDRRADEAIRRIKHDYARSMHSPREVTERVREEKTAQAILRAHKDAYFANFLALESNANVNAAERELAAAETEQVVQEAELESEEGEEDEEESA